MRVDHLPSCAGICQDAKSQLANNEERFIMSIDEADCGDAKGDIGNFCRVLQKSKSLINVK
jgi:hypothetical protein